MSTTEVSTPLTTGTWTVDPAHSRVGFAVRHMGIATVRGEFTKFEGTLEVSADLSSAHAGGSVEVASVFTNEPQRDGHLRSPDFFDVERYPTISFTSTAIEAIDATSFSAGDTGSLRGAGSLAAGFDFRDHRPARACFWQRSYVAHQSAAHVSRV